MKRNPRGPELDIALLIKRAGEHLQQVRQWKEGDTPGGMQLVSHYASKAEALIETLELHCHRNCGAVDNGQQWTQALQPRLQWIIDNYTDKPVKK